MDIVIEGKITADEGLSDIIQTMIDLKHVPNAVLRLTSTDGDLQGRIGFGQGGFILGGRVTGTEETGYPAVRKLLTIEQGTYAILDAGRTHASDVNQTLWIKAAKVVDMLPSLPESPQALLDGGDLDSIQTSIDKAQFDPMDLKVAKQKTADVVHNTDSKARSHDADGSRNARWFAVIVCALVLAAALTYFWDQLFGVFQPH